MRWPLSRVVVAERSMEPTLHPGDWLLTWRGLRPGMPPRIKPGQLVIARHPEVPDMLLVKRADRLLPGGWWLAADNLGAGAVNSASFGPVPPGLIQARVLLRYRRADRTRWTR